jgi:hypothetical protein
MERKGMRLCGRGGLGGGLDEAGGKETSWEI